MELTNQTALITGASRGIGRFIALAMAREGVHLALAARDEAALNAVADEIRAQSDVTVAVIPTDVSDLVQLDALVTQTNTELGHIDILVNNAALERTEVFWTADFHQIEADLAVNIRAPMYLSRQVLPGMIHRNRGHIVNLGSLAGLGGYPHGESYTTTKHGIVGFTRALRASLKNSGRNVSASAICPGYVSEVGIFARKQAEAKIKAPSMMGSSPPRKVARAVLKAIRKDQPEVVVNPMPVRPFLAFFTLAPRLGEWLGPRLGLNKVSNAMIAAEEEHA